jgi:mannose-6-phosphate isomerase-like protein (cupin superfamily)
MILERDILESALENDLFNSLFPLFNYNQKNHSIELINIATEAATSSYTNDNTEVLIILNGKGGISINGTIIPIKSGDVIHVSPRSIRSLSNIEEQNLQAISIRKLSA